MSVQWRYAMLLAFGFSLTAGATLAAGDSPSDTPTCSRGEVYNSSTKKCEKRQAGVLPDQDLANYAYALAKAKRYDEALEVLDLMKNPNTAQALSTMQAGGLSTDQGYAMLNRTVDAQAFMLSANDIFYASAILFLVLIFLVWLAHPVRGAGGAAAASGAH